MRAQTDQIAKTMIEQTRAIKEMSDGARNIGKQINSITRANREHSTASVGLLNNLSSIKQITERNAQGVRDTLRGTEGLIERARTLDSIIDSLSNSDLKDNGRAGKKSRNKKKAKR
jgi:methyl-accepting chemotaxis protein